jgi:5,10-methylenetetrahydrofolate reductase
MTATKKHSLKRLLGQAPDERPFLVLAELVPSPGHDLSQIEKFLTEYESGRSSLPKDVVLAGITLPQSPNGVASLSPADIFSVLEKKSLWSDLDVVPHLTAKDHNLEAVTTYLLGLQKLGLESVLALTGDKPSSGKGVYDVDSLGLIELIMDLNFESFSRARLGSFDEVHQFYILAAVSPFKYTEASQRQQYLKMEKKLRGGAEALITQMGWDARKSEELFRHLKDKDLNVPVFGNVYLLTTATPAPRLMFEGKLPGCLVTKDLFEQIGRETLKDHLERAALQVAMYRDLGAAGVDLGGLLDFNALVSILKRAGEIGRDWRQHRSNLDFGVRTLPNGKPGFYLYEEGGGPREPSRPKKPFSQKTFDLVHRTLMTPGQGLYPPVQKVLKSSRSFREGRGALYKMAWAAEKALKDFAFECQDCGDCFLVENFGLCTLGRCEKGLPNPPCGDALPDGRCAHNFLRPCVGELIYDAAAAEGRTGLKKLEGLVNPGRKPALRETSSVLNYFLHKDHTQQTGLVLIGENLHASISRTAAAMKELLELGPGAYDKPGGALDYIISLIRTQVRHGAAYIDVNVDAFGESDPELRKTMMRDYIRLIRKHGRGVPVCVDSGSPDILRAGLEEWYREAPPSLPAPLLNSIKTYTMEELFPLRNGTPYKFIGLLVDIHSSGSEGAYYGIDELCGMARTMFLAATKRFGFKPEDIFFDSTVFPLAIDIPMTANVPGYTYRAFETIRKIKNDPALKGVHLSLGITNAVRDLPGRKTGVCRAYLAKAQEYGLDAAIVNVMHDYGKRPPAPELMEFVKVFAKQDGSAEAGERAIEAMVRFCKANRKTSLIR